MFKNKYNLIILTLGLVFVLGGCVKKENKIEVKNNPKPVVIDDQGVNNVESKNNKVDTTNWSTYKNEKYRFEVKYPQDWIFDDNLFNGKDESTRDNVVKVSKYFINKFGRKDGGVFLMKVYKKDNIYFEKWADNFIDQIAYKIISKDKIKTAGVDAFYYKFESNEYFGETEILNHNDLIFVLSKIVTINSELKNEIIEYNKQLDGIISSFNFIDLN